jgi:hypothetical protein
LVPMLPMLLLPMLLLPMLLPIGAPILMIH